MLDANGNFFMYIDEDYPVCKNCPPDLQDCVDDMESGDPERYDRSWDMVGTCAKLCLSLREITSDDYYNILRRYGTSG